MSLAATTSPWELALGTTTVRQFGKALLVVLAAVLFGCGIYLVERRALALEERFMQNPADVMMRALGLAHFLVGLLFLLTSRRLRNGTSLLRFGFWTAVAAGVCVLFAQFGALKNPLLVMLFYGSFLLHEVRDEAQVYQAYGDAPGSGPAHAALLSALSRTALAVLMSTLALVFVLRIEITDKHTALDRGPEWLGLAMIGILFALTLLSTGHTWLLARRMGTSLRGVVTAHLPLVLVYAGILAVLLVGSLMGTTGLNLIILVHVGTWLAFVCHQLSKKRAEVKGIWTWLRATPAGFLVLHLGVMLIVLVLFAVRVHLWQRVGFVSELLATKNFVYWAMMHIVMSFGTPR